MKKLLIVMILLMFPFFLTSCGKLEITITGNKKMVFDTSQTLKIELSKEKEFTASSTNDEIASIDENLSVHANGLGSCNIEIKIKDKVVEKFEITVVPVLKIYAKAEVEINETISFKVCSIPSVKDDDFTITSVENDEILKISDDFKQVTSLQEGSCKVFIESTSGGTQAFTINVLSPNREFSITYDLTEQQTENISEDRPLVYSPASLPLELPNIVYKPYALQGYEIYDELGVTDGKIYKDIPVGTKGNITLKPVMGVTRLEVSFEEGKSIIGLNEEIKLSIQKIAIPVGIDEKKLTFTSNDETIASVNELGVITGLKDGYVEIKVSLTDMPEIYMTIGVTVMEELEAIDEIIQVFVDNKIESVVSKNILVTGYQFNYSKRLYSSVTKFLFEPLEITEMIVPSGASNRPGLILDKHYIVVHDTASSKDSANALAHANYVNNGGGGTSWHYSCGNDGIYHQIPDNENAYHAGDGGRQYNLTNTGVLATTNNPEVTISNDGFFVINGTKTEISVPRKVNKAGEFIYDSTGNKIIPATVDINDLGVRTEVVDGYYYIGDTYWNPTYLKLSNTGGNANSIGIETMVNKGSDIFKTWQKCAKLVAKLMDNFSLTIDDVKPHHYFSGKNCPQTMREAEMWPTFIQLVEFEYLMLTKFSDYSITFESHDREFLSNDGRVIKAPLYSQSVSYTITVAKGDYSKSITLSTIIPGNAQYYK